MIYSALIDINWVDKTIRTKVYVTYALEKKINNIIYITVTHSERGHCF